MAKRRMFNLSIVDSDAFLDLPLTSQALYFHLSMRADDDGFVSNPKSICRYIGASNDDLNNLIEKRLILFFEDGVAVIKHWKINNTIQADRYTPTNYTEDLARLKLKDNKAYTLVESCGNGAKSADEKPCIQNGYKMDTKCIQTVYTDKYSIVKNSIVKNNIKNNINSKKKEDKELFSNENNKKENKEVLQQTEEWFNVFWTAYPNKTNKKKSKEIFSKICTSEKLFTTIMEGMKKTVILKAKYEGKQYIPMASSWLNGERWNDEAYQPKQNYYSKHTQQLPGYMETIEQNQQATSSEKADETDLFEIQNLLNNMKGGS